MSLAEYNKKRDFNKTKEPKGSKRKTNSQRFVIQLHRATNKHYDFRLEYDGVLLSWAIPKGLSKNPKIKRLAVHVEDHPLDYIEFEGVIPKGNYGAGSVEIYDSGNYLPIKDFNDGLKKGHLKFLLNGEVFKGAWSLIKLEDNNWIIVKIDDSYFSELKEKKIKNPFNNACVELALLSNEIPKGKKWGFEIKYDGYRIVSYVEGDKVKMLTRNNQDYTSKFYKVAKSLIKLQHEAFVVDGEIVSFDKNGKSDFSLLQKNIKSKSSNFYYVIFDLLALDGEDLRDLPLNKRKNLLKKLLIKGDENLIYSNHVIDNGVKSFKFAKENNLEGIIAKDINSKYTGARSGNWLKIKCYLRQEFVICGYTTSEKNKYLSSLLLAYYDNDNLIYIGKVGSGFTQKLSEELNIKFQSLIVKKCPFPSEINIKDVTWLRPKLVAEVQYMELTKDNLLRQPSFIGLRNDKNPKDIKMEMVKDDD